MEFKPLDDKILIQPAAAAEKTDSGILLPEEAKEPARSGMVLAIGNNVTEIECGDIVLFDHLAGSEITIGKEIYYVIKESEIHGKIIKS